MSINPSSGKDTGNCIRSLIGFHEWREQPNQTLQHTGQHKDPAQHTRIARVYRKWSTRLSRRLPVSEVVWGLRYNFLKLIGHRFARSQPFLFCLVPQLLLVKLLGNFWMRRLKKAVIRIQSATHETKWETLTPPKETNKEACVAHPTPTFGSDIQFCHESQSLWHMRNYSGISLCE